MRGRRLPDAVHRRARRDCDSVPAPPGREARARLRLSAGVRTNRPGARDVEVCDADADAVVPAVTSSRSVRLPARRHRRLHVRGVHRDRRPFQTA